MGYSDSVSYANRTKNNLKPNHLSRGKMTSLNNYPIAMSVYTHTLIHVNTLTLMSVYTLPLVHSNTTTL